MNYREEITNFFDKHIDELRGSGGGGCALPEIVMDLTPRDFLDFAENDLEGELSDKSLVNATSNLKRAVDCQLDCFLFHLKLDDFYRTKRLGVDRKLGFLSKARVFRSKSIEKLNAMRNRLEHHYEIPKIEDIDVYFDLVFAFVSVVENALPLVGPSSHTRLIIETGGGVRIELELEHDGPSITIELEDTKKNYKKEFYCKVAEGDGIEKLEEFAFMFRVHLLVRAFDDGISSSKHLLKQLKC